MGLEVIEFIFEKIGRAFFLLLGFFRGRSFNFGDSTCEVVGFVLVIIFVTFLMALAKVFYV